MVTSLFSVFLWNRSYRNIVSHFPHSQLYMNTCVSPRYFDKQHWRHSYMGVPAVRSFMSENIMAEKHKKNVNRNKHWQRHIHWDGKYAVNRPYPAFFLTNSVYHLNDVILLMLFFITSNHFPFKKKHRRASNTTDVVFSERVDKMHVLPSKYPYVTPF